MNVLIIYAHPNRQSFNHAILESFTRGLIDAGHAYEVVDLYASRFNPVLSGEDLAGVMEGKTSQEVKTQQEKVGRADAIVFVHPVWWTGPPAILKGWIDRVFTMGFAYKFDEKTGRPLGLLKHRKAMVINTVGAREEDARMTGATEALKKVEVDGVFQFCGIDNVQHVAFYDVIRTDNATRKGWLEKTYQLGKTF